MLVVALPKPPGSVEKLSLQEANRLAEQRQADSSARIDEKTQAMKAPAAG